VRSAISATTWLLDLVIGIGNVHKYLLPDRERMSGIIRTTKINLSYSRQLSVFDAWLWVSVSPLYP